MNDSTSKLVSQVERRQLLQRGKKTNDLALEHGYWSDMRTSMGGRLGKAAALTL